MSSSSTTEHPASTLLNHIPPNAEATIKVTITITNNDESTSTTTSTTTITTHKLSTDNEAMNLVAAPATGPETLAAAHTLLAMSRGDGPNTAAVTAAPAATPVSERERILRVLEERKKASKRGGRRGHKIGATEGLIAAEPTE
ncbi:hypothetical protein H2198_010460 [Neophaeococcomyces mojaviensis]|uniref:Uncharacterized protein n=1 Tax=Neophaeococcomyces mojaviensis TaxID=3383035 RepID=A0ACC2ZRP1_9EURO|nr:hypothetical protein H2198_010460 [Knufia sp. JES_112]